MQRLLAIGSRGSPLAIAQARAAQRAIGEALGVVDAVLDDALPITVVRTSGDRITDRTLADAGGKGLFTKELEEALLDRRIDVAVHSLKDVPTRLAPGVALAAMLERRDPRDALVCETASSIAELPHGAVVGTASARRAAQVRALRPDISTTLLRGNVQTRIDKIHAGDVDATFLALAGLDRLGAGAAASSIIEPEEMLPAAGQGVVTLQTRADGTWRERLGIVNDEAASVRVAAERSFLDVLDGSCRTPIAALAELSGERLRLRAEVLTYDGARRWTRDETMTLGAARYDDADALGRRLASSIREEAGDALPVDA